MSALYTAAAVFFLFGITVFVHELGHFLVARWSGMIVDVFSIGFGPAIWKRKIGSVTYKIGLVPFGGYVALPQMDPSDRKPDEGEEAKELPRVAPWKRVLVALAGGAGNMVLALFLAYLVYWIGKPSSPRERNCIIGFAETNSAAYEAGVRIGDEIISVNGEPVSNWDDFAMKAALLQEVSLGVRSVEGVREIKVPTEKNIIGVWSVEGIHPVNFSDVGSVFSGSSAEAAGIRPGDRIIEFNNQVLWSREHLIWLVNEARDQEVPAVVLRGGEQVAVSVTPRYNEDTGRALIGVGFSMLDMDYDSVVHPTPSSQIKGHATAIFRFIRALVTPAQARAAAQGVGGPVAILVIFWWAVQNSFMVAVWFACFINVHLAIINQIPMPPFDGGHIVFCLLEMITRRPVNARIFSLLMNTFFYTLLILLVFLSYRDVVRLILPQFSNHRAAEAPAQITNQAPDEAP
jgi:regulator of sigma E protease